MLPPQKNNPSWVPICCVVDIERGVVVLRGAHDPCPLLVSLLQAGGSDRGAVT